MALPTHQEIVSDMLAALRASEPEIDTPIGSFVHKLADAFAEVVHEASLDSYLTRYTYDIDAKSGADLDEFVRVFGFSRLPSRRAYGQVTFSRTGSSALRVIIPQGTQVRTSDGIIVATAVSAAMVSGDTSVTVPCVAVTGGTSGNVGAGTLNVRKTPLSGISSVTNLNSFTGGTDAETDESLRKRFKATVFRNISGTTQAYLGTALDNPNVTQANVIGASKVWRERIEVASGEATSTVPDAAYVYPGTSIVGPDIQGGDILGIDVAYSFDETNLDGSDLKPLITSLDSDLMPDGVYDVEFEYVPLSSRNDPENGITNRVDVYVKGERAQAASETLIFKSARTFNETGGSPRERFNFQRASTEDTPADGNFFVPMTFVPILDPSTIDTIEIMGSSGGVPVTYNEGTHFFLVHDITAEGLSPRSLAGLEIVSAANGSGVIDPMDDADFTVDYVYNAVPTEVEAQIKNWRMVGQDCWVHSAKLRRLRMYFAVILQYGITKSQIEDDLEAALSAHLDTIGFNNTLQASDILQVAHNVPGVDAVRFLTDEDDPTNYAIQRVDPQGSVLETYASAVTPKRALDVVYADDEVPVLDQVVVTVKAENTWGSV